MKIFNKFSVVALAVVSVFGLVGPVPAFAATAPVLGSMAPYGVVSSTFTNSNTAPQTIINGAVCYTTGPATQPLTITGVEGACPGAANQDQIDALAIINGQSCTDLGASVALDNVAGHLTGIYTPGCYSTSGAGATSMTITTGQTVTLSGAGVYIFKAAGALKPAANTTVVLTNGATADKVFWAPVEATTIGANSAFVGNIIDAAGITIGQFSTLSGRALAFGGTVTLDANTITVPTTLNVIKHVVNNNGGTSVAGDFSTTITGVTTATPTAAGVEDPGVNNVLTSVGAYTVDEGAHVGYEKILSADCSGTIASGDTKVCTITNNDIAPELVVITHVVGGAAVAADFSTTITGVTTATPTAAGVESPGVNNVLTSVGAYTVDEGAHVGYDKTLSVGCSGTIALGETKTCTITNTYIAPTPASATVYAVANYEVPLPLINITKVPSPLALPLGAGPVTYTYKLSNIGIVGISGSWLTVKDDSCDPIKFISGDTNNNSVLDPNETWVYTCTKTLSKTETNIVTAHGSANGWDVYDTASATVVVAAPLTPPLIHLVKTPSTFILPSTGGPVTYTYTVTNPGTEPLNDVVITDDKCTGLPGRVLEHPGDLNKNDLLESNETWTFTCQSDLTQTTMNTGTATGHANGFTAVDTSLVTVVVTSVAPAAVVTTPKLPNTGFGPSENDLPWNAITIVSGFLLFLSLLVVEKKRHRIKK